jgi:hypothetical protein
MIVLEDNDVVARARLSFKNLVIINIIILVLTIAGVYLGTVKVSLYFAIFYAIEALMFVVFFIPVFTYYLFNRKSIKLAASKAMLCFGDFYQYMTPW